MLRFVRGLIASLGDRTGAGSPGRILGLVCVILFLSCPASAAVVGKAENQIATFEEVQPNVFLFPDTCNVYLIRRGDRAMAIDCGSGKVRPRLVIIPCSLSSMKLTRSRRQGDGGDRKKQKRLTPWPFRSFALFLVA